MLKPKEITIISAKGAFSIFRKPANAKAQYDFSELLELRQLLSNEKARILHSIKKENPKSIYDLSKRVGRGFKSVNDDIKILKKFGFIKLTPEKTKNRIRFKPEIITDSLTINFKI